LQRVEKILEGFGAEIAPHVRQAPAVGGRPFMQVSKWLGHSTFTLTLDVYGDYIPDDGGALNTLPEPPTPAKQADLLSNVVSLFGRQAN
jgi:integrase